MKWVFGIIGTVIGGMALFIVTPQAKDIVLPSLPVNAIIAFDQDECPKIGWERLSGTEGRFLLGSGGQSKSGESGGSSTATIGIANLPEGYRYARESDTWEDFDNYNNASGTGSAPASSDPVHGKKEGWDQGKGVSLDIIPPYRVVTFCRKTMPDHKIVHRPDAAYEKRYAVQPDTNM